MAPISIALRRTLLLVAAAIGIGAALSWRRGHATTPTPGEAPQWPAWPDAPAPADPATTEQGWLPANADGSTPDSHPVKAKDASGIFHVPDGRFYDRTKPDRCYPTAAAAEADGYRQSKA
jgi:hypothetical protein